MGKKVHIDEKLFLDLYNKGLGERKIAEQLLTTRAVIKGIRRKMQLKPNFMQPSVDINKLEELVKNGYSDKEIAELCEVSISCIHSLRNRYVRKRSKEETQFFAKKSYNYFNIFEDKDLMYAITGTLLGDGWITNSSKESAKFGFAHKEDNLDYILYKADLLKNIKSSISYKKAKENFFIKEKRVIHSQPQYSFKSKSSPSLYKLQNLLYKDGVKTITKEYLDYMNELSIALYYFDDGSKITSKLRKNYFTYKIAMYSFTEESKIMLKDWLFEKFEIKSTCPGDVLTIKACSRDKFKTILQKYCVQSMQYKI